MHQNGKQATRNLPFKTNGLSLHAAEIVKKKQLLTDKQREAFKNPYRGWLEDKNNDDNLGEKNSNLTVGQNGNLAEKNSNLIVGQNGNLAEKNSNSAEKMVNLARIKNNLAEKNNNNENGINNKVNGVTSEKQQQAFKPEPIVTLTRDQITEINERLKQVSKSEVFNEKKSKNDSAVEFQKKYSGNLAANAAAAEKLVDSSESLSELYSDEADLELDSELLQEYLEKSGDKEFMELQEYRRTLPTFDFASDIVDVLDNNQVVVICGETGSGKTTQVCQYFLDDAILNGKGSTCRILCTQPRRISAISVAERVAEERGEDVGLSVGYSIRLESRLPTRTAGTITFVTTGVVFQYLKEDPDLSRVSMIIVDEVHERDILTDFMLAILKDLVSRRSDVKVILMSATLDAQKFSQYFNNCAIFNIPGQLYPVDQFYLEEVLTKTKFAYKVKPLLYVPRKKPKKVVEFENLLIPYVRSLEARNKYPRSVTKQLLLPDSEELNNDLILSLIEYICENDQDNNSAILIFMPGWDAITSLIKKLEASYTFNDSQFIIIPLHSLVPSVNQKEIFNKPPPGKRKLIISTNIAETSITINDVVHVIDTGKIKMNNFDVKKNIETLDNEWTSRANSKQRRGRAGRVQAGYCYHLFTRARESTMEESKKPEILRKRLEEVILQIKMLKLGNAMKFLSKLMDAPSKEAVALGIRRLINLKALDSKENLTPLGFHLAHLPMDPQTGKMVIFGAIFSCIDPILSVAASLTHRDIFYIPLDKDKDADEVRQHLSKGTRSDHMTAVYAIQGYEKARLNYNDRKYCYANYLSNSNLKQIVHLKRQFASYLFRMKYLPSAGYKDTAANQNSDNVGVILAVIAAGLYPNVAEAKMAGLKNPCLTVRTSEDGVICLHRKSVNKKTVGEALSPFFVYFMKLKSSSILLFDTSMIMPLPLLFFGDVFTWSNQRLYNDSLNGTIVSTVPAGKIRIGCPGQETFNVILNLKQQLDKFLDHKINCPSPTDWCEEAPETLVIKTVVKLIANEYQQVIDFEKSKKLEDTDDMDNWN